MEILKVSSKSNAFSIVSDTESFDIVNKIIVSINNII